MNKKVSKSKKQKAKNDSDLKFNKPVEFNLGLVLEKSSKSSAQNDNRHYSKSQKKKVEIDKKRVISTTNEAHLPVIIRREPVVIQKSEPIENTVEKQATEETPKKKKLTSLKRKILNEDMKNDIVEEKVFELIDVITDDIDIQDTQKEVIQENKNQSKLFINDIFVSEDNIELRTAIQNYIKSIAKVSRSLYLKDIEKAKQRRFIMTGLHETIHYAKYNKAQFICIAEDIINMKDTERMVKTIIDNSRENSIPVVQCFTRRKLARLFGRGQSMSCVCILKDSFTVVDELKQLQDILLKYHL